MADLFQREERCTVVPNSLEAIKRHMLGVLLGKQTAVAHHCDMCD
jgi:hypothetical protein